MVFKSKSGGVSEIPLESEVWNIAPQYTHLKILKLLYECDKLQKIALYGSEDMDEILPEKLRSLRRIESLKRLRTTLLMLKENSYFIIKKEDKKILEGYEEILREIPKKIEECHKFTKPKINSPEVVEIDEEKFLKIFEELSKIKEDINTPLNKANLIFKSSDSFDIDDIREDFVRGGYG